VLQTTAGNQPEVSLNPSTKTYVLYLYHSSRLSCYSLQNSPGRPTLVVAVNKEVEDPEEISSVAKDATMRFQQDFHL